MPKINDYITDDLTRRARDPEQLSDALSRQRETVERVREMVDEEPSELNVSHLGREASRLADYLLLSGEFDEALALKAEAVDVWRRLERDKARFLAELDAAEIVFEVGRRGEAFEQLDRLVERSQADEFAVYRDFALALRGRLRARDGDRSGARADLESALELRRERGSERQIEQTERLIEIIESGAASR